LYYPPHTFKSVTLALPDPVDVGRLERALRSLVPSLLRAKGFVCPTRDPDGRSVVELSGRRVVIRDWNAAPAPESALVLIGLDDPPDAPALATALTTALATAPGVALR
jgi:G3E family GTPase